MSRCYGYSVAFIPRKEILVCQLHCGKFLPRDLLHLEESREQCGAPSLLCVVRATGLILQVMPLVVELNIWPLLRKLSQSEVLC